MGDRTRRARATPGEGETRAARSRPGSVSELRWHPLLAQWVITSTHRQDRTFLPPRDYFPLCPTRDGSSETEVPTPDYDIVVFDNRFPSLQPDPPPPAVAGTELMPVRPAVGACEVILYQSDHDTTLAEASLARLRHVISVWADRTRELGRRPGIEYVFVFENKGEPIGVTISHPHGQIYAYPFVPPVIETELAAYRDHSDRAGRCLGCELLDAEVGDGRRVVVETKKWVAVVPFYARWPYEVHVTPRRHLGWLHELDADEVEDLARVLKTVTCKYDALFGFSLPYVMAIHQRPVGDAADHAYHLHFEFYPPNRTESKLKYTAGSEAGAGTFINDTLPEETAAILRSREPLDPSRLTE
jgi:UDPglucose--hexose-1-phosphate uridylyltransferase